MSRAAVLFATGFEEIESMTIVDVLRRAGIETKMIGLEDHLVKGAHQVTVKVDALIDELDSNNYDAIILPGGAPGYLNLKADHRVLDLLNKTNEDGKLIAAICASPVVLAAAGLLQGKNCTVYPGMEEELRKAGGKLVDDVVVIDDNLITSKGPATTMLFALKLVELLTDASTAEDVKKKTLFPLVYRED